MHSSILAWKIPWKVESGRLQSMESERIRHDRATEHTSIRKTEGCFKIGRQSLDGNILECDGFPWPPKSCLFTQLPLSHS